MIPQIMFTTPASGLFNTMSTIPKDIRGRPRSMEIRSTLSLSMTLTYLNLLNNAAQRAVIHTPKTKSAFEARS